MYKIKIEKEKLLKRIYQFQNMVILTQNISEEKAKEYICDLDIETIAFSIRCFPEDKKELIKAIEMYKRQ